VHDENCDDGSDNTEGCKIGCKTGSLSTWICTGGDYTSASICSPNCGDSKIVGNETCEDGT